MALSFQGEHTPIPSGEGASPVLRGPLSSKLKHKVDRHVQICQHCQSCVSHHHRLSNKQKSQHFKLHTIHKLQKYISENEICDKSVFYYITIHICFPYLRAVLKL